jgi:hypothetical protein
MFDIPSIPILYRVILMLALAVSCVTFGYVQGIRSEADRNADYRSSVEATAVAQLATVAAKVKQQKQITEDTANAYTQALYYLRNHPVNPRVRQSSHCGGSAMPAVPDATTGVDGGPADAGDGAVSPAPDIETACRETTLQLIWLQDWITLEARP